MRMLAMNPLMHETERRRANHVSRVVHSPSVSSDTDKEGDALDDDVDELDPVDGFPSPPARVRPRRRFVKPGVTTYELSFSRRPARRVSASKDEISDDKEADEYHPALPGAYRPTPVVSSLSSVLTEVMTGKTQALNNIIDTTPPQPNVTYVVEHAHDGTPYVAASDGNRYFENSTIGQIFLNPVSSQSEPKAEESNLNFIQSGGWNHQQQSTRRPDLVDGVITTGDGSAESDVDTKKGSKALLSFKNFHKSKKKTGLADMGTGQEKENTMQDTHNGISVPNPDRNRAGSCWEPTAHQDTAQEFQEQQLASVQLLDSTGMLSAQQASSDLLVESETASNSSSSSSIKTLPRLQPKKDLPAPPLAVNAYDEDDNPLCRSFQNVRDVDSMRSSLRKEEHNDDHEHDNEHDDIAVDGEIPDADSPDFSGRVRVSSGATSVVEFVGGFKGQLSRRTGANGLITRKRAVRHARLTAEEQKAADLAKKIREARNRIPLEFRDEYQSSAGQKQLQKKKKWRAVSRHVHFNTDVLVREFDVESEEEDDGYNSPDEIVDAVQLVSKRDVVYAEDVVSTFPMEQLELPPNQHETIGHDFPSPPSTDNADEANRYAQDPLTFSQLKNDKRMSFSEL